MSITFGDYHDKLRASIVIEAIRAGISTDRLETVSEELLFKVWRNTILEISFPLEKEAFRLLNEEQQKAHLPSTSGLSFESFLRSFWSGVLATIPAETVH